MTKYDGYREREDFKTMNNKELLNRVHVENKNQDKQIETLIGVSKEGGILARDIGTNLERQNIKLDKLGDDMEVVETKMSKTRAKFEKFIENNSYCCLYVIMVILIVALALIIILV